MPFHYVQFFTATILNWIPVLQNDSYKNIIIDSLNYLVSKGKCDIYAFVIMPNHIHLIWRINQHFERSNIQRDFLKFTGQQIKFRLQDKKAPLLDKFEINLKDRKYQFWKRNALSIDLYSREVIEQKLDYLHANPVSGKWNLAEDFFAYPYSSASFYEESKTNFSFLKHYMEFFEE
ncbi:MAG: transposase [Bacteroidota bacterium]